MSSLQSVFIANRGEIAVRIARTCDRLGIASTVSSGDFLDVEAQVAQAVAAGADAVHPGYGFLSENPVFARAVTAAGLAWIGPPPEAMEAMARKDHARDIAVAAGVPVVPRGEDSSYPVLVKAAAGGGGKGMRIVRSADELDEAVASAKREALSAFGDDTILIERFVEHGRHIEVQVMADTHGNVLHLWERDCSAQRRHQKVLEEAPAPTISDDVRRLVTASAVALARQVGYTNAGTVEFLLDADTDEAFFLEMNTRLQVEHPVTEAITGLDLVQLQLIVAAGKPLPITQDDVRVTGHAIEARIYAEDAYGGFLPQAGTVTHVEWPEGVRVDHALEDKQEVSTAFDPMLAKIIVHGLDREAARLALVDALDRTAIFGLTTNVGFLRALAAGDEFRDAAVDTAWLDRNPLPPPDDAGARALAGVVLDIALRAEPRGPWQPDRFRTAGDRGPLVEHGRDLFYGSSWASGEEAGQGLHRAGDDEHGDGFVLRGRHGTEVVLHGQRFVLDEPDPWGGTAAAGDGALTAPMPGTVLDVRVAEGDGVDEGQVLGVLEAMKMELSLKAPFAGTVTKVDATTGAQVRLGDTLFVVEKAKDPA